MKAILPACLHSPLAENPQPHLRSQLMKSFAELLENIPELETLLSYHFHTPSLLAVSLTHCSFVNEAKETKEHNERLEFLGDAVLDLLISEFLFQKLPTEPEGELSSLRATLVEASACCSYLEKLGVEPYLLLGKGERKSGRGRSSILADLFEAIIGAIYLDGGIEAARSFLFGHFTKEIEERLRSPTHNWKALLQDWCQRKHQVTPSYHVVEESGPDHAKRFVMDVLIAGKPFGRGRGSSKKEAQQAAAKEALKKAEINED